MRTLHRYIVVDYLVMFCTTLLIITFVMSMAAVVRAVDYAARGASLALFGELFMVVLPYMLSFAIPVSTLTACLILFGRLSFDGELTAMRASGMSLWNIVAPIVIVSVLLSAFCVYLNSYVAPRSKDGKRNILQRIGAEDPMNLLVPGEFIRDFPGMMIYIGDRQGAAVRDVIVYKIDAKGLSANLEARDGMLRVEGKERFVIDLYKVRIEQEEKGSTIEAPKKQIINAEYYPISIDLGGMDKGRRVKKHGEMTLNELLENIRDVKRAYPGVTSEHLRKHRMGMILETNSRFALALSCFAFTLIAIPLGMKSRRKESSVGMGIALGLVLFYYLFMSLADSLVYQPNLRPDLIIWVPVIFCELLGIYLINRMK